MILPKIDITIMFCSQPVIYDRHVWLFIRSISDGMCLHVPDGHALKKQVLHCEKQLAYKSLLVNGNAMSKWETIVLTSTELARIFTKGDPSVMLFGKVYNLSGSKGEALHKFHFPNIDLHKGKNHLGLIPMPLDMINSLPWVLFKLIGNRHRDEYYFEKHYREQSTKI